MNENELCRFLNHKVAQYQTPAFVEEDPISVPHQYSRLQDIEIAGLFSALFAWGRRSLILKKANFLMELMDNSPYSFIVHHEEKDLKRFLGFVHRTFNATDILFLISFLRQHYKKHASLEFAFCHHLERDDNSVEKALNGFYHCVFGENNSIRTKKHISAPFKKSACKRMNMFLRWMVRKDAEGIDFGIWKNIRPEQLVIPVDVHVYRVAVRLGLLSTKKTMNWKLALELTNKLKEFDPEDPVKYDFALFGLGVIEKFK